MPRTAAIAMITTAVLSLAAAVPAAAIPRDDHDLRPTIPLFATISDGEHAASTYVDGVLTPESAGHRDLFTAASLRRGELRSAAVEVSNSVTAPPEVLALAPGGRTVYVVERLGGRSPGDTLASQLPAGRRLSTIDLTDPSVPKIIGSTEIAPMPRPSRSARMGGRSRSCPTRRRPRWCNCCRSTMMGGRAFR